MGWLGAVSNAVVFIIGLAAGAATASGLSRLRATRARNAGLTETRYTAPSHWPAGVVLTAADPTISHVITWSPSVTEVPYTTES